jgi:hypothetical protein
MSSKDNYNNDDFEKMFSEIINSDQLKDISEDMTLDISMGPKELLLIQQSLSDNISNISEIICSIIEQEKSDLISDKEFFEILGSLYKISEDLNDHILDHYSKIQAVIINDEDDEDNEWFVFVDDEDYNDIEEEEDCDDYDADDE